MKRLSIVVVVILFLANRHLYSQIENGLAALQIGVGARAAAMGEAFNAVADDAASAFWNPAGQVWLPKRQAHFTHTEWFQDVQQNAVSVVFPHNKIAFGIHALLNSVSGIEQRIYPTEEPLSTFSAHDFILGLTVAKKFADKLAIGCNLRYLNEKIYIESASGFTIDAGLQIRAPVKGLTAGMSLQHFGATGKLKTEKIRLPKTARLGVTFQLPSSWVKMNWLFAADYVHIFDQGDACNFGTELRPWPLLALRLGYQAGYDTHDISAGFGVKLGSFLLDYAYVPFRQDLGTSHRFSFSAFF